MNLNWHPRPRILEHDDLDAPSLFTAEAMLSLARQRKGLSDSEVPEVCVLDPDGDLERHLQARGQLRDAVHWACFHTRLAVCEGRNQRFGIIGESVQRLGEWERGQYDRPGRCRLEYHGWRGCCG